MDSQGRSANATLIQELIMAYQPNIPTGTVDFDQDYLNLLGNFQQLDVSFGIDHLPFSNNTAQLGYHTVAHLITQSGNPPSSTAGQVYSKVASIPSGGDTQLFYRTVNGGIEQISGSSASNNGFGWFSGILAQWGVISATSASSVAVTFGVAFPNNVFNAQVTRARTNASNPGANYVYYIDDSTFGNTGFNIISQDGHTWIYYWFAVGN